jgi:hypothetical protein
MPKNKEKPGEEPVSAAATHRAAGLLRKGFTAETRRARSDTEKKGVRSEKN